MGKERGPGRPDEQVALAGRLFIELRSQSPIQLQLAGPLPDITLWFKADNRSQLQVELDRLLVEVWMQQPLAEGAVLHRYIVKPNEWIDGIRFHKYLTPAQADLARHRLTDESQPGGANLRLQLSAYYNTPLGTVTVFNNMIERPRNEYSFYL